MGGGLMQLVAYGAQDVYLTGNPQITFFKVVYRRHTNFSIEMDELPVDTAKPGGTFSVQVLRNGDLATRMYLRLDVPALPSSFLPTPGGNGDAVAATKVAWVRRLGHACIKHVKIQIGGTDIDKHVGTWLELWYELTHTVEQERGYDAMIGDVPDMTTLVGAPTVTGANVINGYRMYVPLQFWFNRNPGLALPLIALQYHDVRLYVEMEDLNKLICWSGVTQPNFSAVSSYDSAGIMVDYVYLDSEERRRFAQVGHEYLIEQVQFPGVDTVSTSSVKTKLNFNHPCKELVWALKNGAYNGSGNVFGTNQGGRFLTYTNDDAAWESAVDYAAANLAYGCIVPSVLDDDTSIAASIATATTWGGATVVNLTCANNIPAGQSVATLTATIATIGGVVYTLNVFATIANNSTKVIETTAPLCTVITNALFQTSSTTVGLNKVLDLCRRSTFTNDNALVTCNLTVAAAAADRCAVTLSPTLVVTGHRLTLTDMSIPTAQYTDYRQSTATTGVNPWDVTVNQHHNFGVRLDGVGNPVAYGNIQLNGQDRFDIVEGSYFNYVQPHQHHTRTPADGINVYSFGLHPEQHQPSGTANLSRIDTTILNLNFADPLRTSANPALNLYTNAAYYYFATNYNVLRIMSGMGGLAYSN